MSIQELLKKEVFLLGVPGILRKSISISSAIRINWKWMNVLFGIGRYTDYTK